MPNAMPPTDGSALKGKRGLQRVLKATRYSIDGLAQAWRHEDAFRQEAVLAALMLSLLLAGGTWAAILAANFLR